MKEKSDILLSRLSDFLVDQIGLCFPQHRRPELERGIVLAAKDFGFDDIESCIGWLLSSPLTKNQIEVLSSHLTIGETYFFREKRTFEILEEQILPELIQRRRGSERRLRIWSAACCTGEESYSIAILLDRLIPDRGNWNITILATDINPHFFQKAVKGAYTPWSFRDAPQWLRDNYFRRNKEGLFEISPTIKKLVTFSYLNLAENSYPSLITNTNAMDLILCRNVLIYFAQDRSRKVVQNLHRSLIDGGWLIPGLTETSQSLFCEFKTVNFPGAIFYQKIIAAEPVESVVPQLIAPIPKGAINRGTQGRSSGTAVASDDLYHQGLQGYEEGRYAETVDSLASEKHQKKGEDLAFLARAYANQGKIAEALDSCEKAIQNDKLDARLHFLRATILQEQDQIVQAIVSLKRALYLDHGFVLAHFTLGTLTLQHGNSKEAEKHFKNALHLLEKHSSEDIVPESEGITAGRLRQIIQSRRVQ